MLLQFAHERMGNLCLRGPLNRRNNFFGVNNVKKMAMFALGLALTFGMVSDSWAQTGGAGGAGTGTGGTASGTGAKGGLPGTGSSTTPGSSTNSPTTNPSR